MKTYSELITIPSFEERVKYLQTRSMIGDFTFGGSRILNQTLYRSHEWKRFRDEIIIRDNGCDLAFDGMDIFGRIIIHHINPLTIEDVKRRADCIFDPENVVCVSHNTHEVIHYGLDVIHSSFTERKVGDTTLWKQHI